MKDPEVVKEELESISCFKNVTVDYNEEKDIFDVFVRIKGDEEAEYANTKDILNNIPNLEYQYNDFGIFELWFSSKNTKKVLQELKDNF